MHYTNPIQMLQHYIRYGNMPLKKYPLALGYLLKLTWMWPGVAWERFFLREEIKATFIEEPIVFVLGHHRSGTTLLHKLLTADPQWAYPLTYDFAFSYSPKPVRNIVLPTLQKVFDWVDLKHSHFNNYSMNLADPLEEDMSMIAGGIGVSGFWGDIFPLQRQHFTKKNIVFDKKDKQRFQEAYLHYLKKLSRQYEGKPLMLKNPPNTGRINALLELFPTAKFVFIHRNPYQVFFSTRALWHRTILKIYTLQSITAEQIDDLIFQYYKTLTDAYLSQRENIPTENLIEIRYEEMEKKPFEVIQRIYTELRLPNWETAKTHLLHKIQQERHYKKYSYQYSETVQDRIYREWGTYIDLWEYKRL